MNRINRLFYNRRDKVLSVYFTAGYPQADHTVPVITALAAAGADMIEIGMPFSDPLADGPVIQQSSTAALQQGMTLPLLLAQLEGIRRQTDVPLILMGYLNPVLQYGMKAFCAQAAAAGIDGVILPDLPPEVWRASYASLFEAHDLKPVFLVTPQTPEARIRMIDALADSFIYVVTAPGITGGQVSFTPEHHTYFRRVQDMQLNNPLLAGFGIHDHMGFQTVCRYTDGAIIGSSFIKALAEDASPAAITAFIKRIKDDHTTNAATV